MKKSNASNILLASARCGSQDGCEWNSWVLFFEFLTTIFFFRAIHGNGDFQYYYIKGDKNGIKIHLEVPLIWTPKNDVVFRKYCGKKSCQIIDTMKKCLVCLLEFFWNGTIGPKSCFWLSSGILLEWNDFHLPEFWKNRSFFSIFFFCSGISVSQFVDFDKKTIFFSFLFLLEFWKSFRSL